MGDDKMVAVFCGTCGACGPDEYGSSNEWNRRAPVSGEAVAWRYRWPDQENQRWEATTSKDLADRNTNLGAEIEPLGVLAAHPKPAGEGGWDREICTGCSSSISIEEIKARGIRSCCPDRHMVKVVDLVNAYTGRPPAGEGVEALREKIERMEARMKRRAAADWSYFIEGGEGDDLRAILSTLSGGLKP